jgi:hypothetical protein
MHAMADRNPSAAKFLPVIVPQATHRGPMANRAVPIPKASIA